MSNPADSEQLARLWDFAAEFAGRLGHDLANILTGIRGFSELALENLPADHSVTPFLRDGLRSCKRGIDLSQRLHRLRAIADCSSPSSVASVFEAARAQIEPSLPAGISLAIDLERGLPPAAIAPEVVLSIVVELSRNAVEACRGGGSVSLKASAVALTAEQAAGLIGRARAGRHIELRIADTGSGLSASIRDEILKVPLLTKKQGHWGLGLAIVFRALCACRGGLALEDAPEKGTVARAFVPIA